MLAGRTGHGAIVNRAGHRALALDLDAPVAGGWYGENDAGEFDGRLYEYAQWRLQALQPLLPDETVIAALRGYADRVLRYGTTSLQAMSMRPPRRFLPLWQRSGARQRLRLILLPLPRSEEHTSELQSLMRIPYAAFCL